MKEVIIRTDASTTIGSGHVMRCLTIAKKLDQSGFRVRFWMMDVPGNLIHYIQSQGFANLQAPDYADLYIVDHYGIDKTWERDHRRYTKHMMVIDDLANREHACDVLLDPNIVPVFQTRYNGLVPEHCKQLLGPQYLIMRDEFIAARQNLRVRSGQVDRLMIFMGGTDPTLETLKVLKALGTAETRFKDIDVVVGDGNAHKEEIRSTCETRGYHYHCQINYMAQLMQQADFLIGAGGSTAWERCYVGLPSSSTMVAQNQVAGTVYASQLGAVWNLGWHADVTTRTYAEFMDTLPWQATVLKELSRIGLQLTGTVDPNPWLHEIVEMMTC
jgi:UDP-2,4-diacetamido-2,4,6-trideoxy-beta-L-altropyranose hydrolase